MTAVDTALAARLAWALRQARIELGEDVVVMGDGVTARLAAELAHAAGAATVRLVAPSHVSDEAPNSADVLIYLAEGWPALGESLRLVRDRGRALVLTAGGPPVDFNVYSDLHRRSLQLMSAELPDAAPEAMMRFARFMAASGRLKAV
jgi:threonine dehydrogenase-like Zn-dependent dehydrogenase